MNKKIIIIITIALLAIFIILGWFVFGLNKDSKQSNTQQNTTQNNQAKSDLKVACNIYTVEVAKKYLGESAKIGDTASSNSVTEGKDVTTSTCLYENGAEIAKIINIQLIGAKNDAGKSWIKSTFKSSPTELAKSINEESPVLETVTGVGEEAYWNPDMGQLCVLVQDTKYWLTIQGSTKSTEEEKANLKLMAQDLLVQL